MPVLQLDLLPESQEGDDKGHKSRRLSGEA